MSVPLSDFMGNSMEKVRQMFDANTIIGDPIKTDDGVTIIPISKVSLGFAGGGSDIPSKSSTGGQTPFGGGTGAGVTITPVAFLVVKEGSVRILPVAEPASSSVERLIEMAPDLIDKLSALIQNKKNKEDATEN